MSLREKCREALELRERVGSGFTAWDAMGAIGPLLDDAEREIAGLKAARSAMAADLNTAATENAALAQEVRANRAFWDCPDDRPFKGHRIATEYEAARAANEAAGIPRGDDVNG